MLLTKDQITSGLRALDAKARSTSQMVDIAIYGGASLALAFNMREATRDVDAVIKGNRAFVRQAVEEIAEANSWPSDWLNEGVKGFVSDKERLLLMQDFQGSPHGGLRIYTPTAEYLLAMKCMAMRIDDPDAAHDVRDIKNLAKMLHMTKEEQFFETIEQFYPANRISAKTTFGVQEIAQQLEHERRLSHLSQLPVEERIALLFIIECCDLTKSTNDFANVGTKGFRLAFDEIASLAKIEADGALTVVAELLSQDAPWPSATATAVATALEGRPGGPSRVAERIKKVVLEIEKTQSRSRE